MGSSTEPHALRRLLTINGHGAWEWNPAADTVQWSEGIETMFGIDDGKFRGTYAAYCELIHPGDLNMVLAAIESVVRGDSDEYSLEHRILTPTGETRWLACTGYASRVNGALGTLYGTVSDITARKHVEAELRDREDRFLAAMLHSPIGMALVGDGARFLDVNPAFCTLIGYSREELIGKTFRDITVAEDIPASSSLVRSLLEGQRTTGQTDKRYIHKDGHIVWAQLNLSIVRAADGKPQYFIAQIQDIGERRAAERAVRESAEMLAQLVENAREVIWLRDAESGKLLYISSRYEAVYGGKLADVLADERAWLEQVLPEDRPGLVEEYESKFHIGGLDREFRVKRDGEIRWLHARTFPVRDAGGKIVRIAGAAEDITERRRIEEQLRHAQKMEAFGQLAGGVAHDFNNILATIIPLAELVSRTIDSPRARESLEDIGEAARRAATLTRQLLQLSRKDVLQPRDVDLNDTVANLATMLRRVLREDISIAMKLVERRLPVCADVDMIGQVVMNLAVNARDAMPNGGTLRLETSVVDLDAHDVERIPEGRPGTYACLAVQDTGHGISADVMPRLFEPFFTTKPAGVGTGLGLATVSGIVQQHDGVVDVSSEVGAGATFRVMLPLKPLVKPIVPVRSRLPALPGGTETLLVVEDEPQVRTATARVLEYHGYRVLLAGDASEALAVLDRGDERVALVITDLVMPGAIGARDLVTMLRARVPKVKLVLTSGYNEDFYGPELRLSPGEQFLAKPARIEDLLGVIRRALDS